MTPNTALGKCVLPPDCGQSGAINPQTDRCETAATDSCAAGYSNPLLVSVTPRNPSAGAISRVTIQAGDAGIVFGSSSGNVGTLAVSGVMFSGGPVSDGPVGAIMASGSTIYVYKQGVSPWTLDAVADQIQVGGSYVSGTVFVTDTDGVKGIMCITANKNQAVFYQDPACTVESGRLAFYPKRSSDGASLCLKDPTCESSGLYDALSQSCRISPAQSCSLPYQQIATRCEAPLLASYCLTGGGYDPAGNMCLSPATIDCPPGSEPPQGTVCWSSAICNNGILNTEFDECQANVVHGCPDDYTWNPVARTCERLPACGSPGTFNTVAGACRYPVSYRCLAAGYTYADNACIATPVCTFGFMDYERGMCSVDLIRDCSAFPDYLFNTTTMLCEIAVPCPAPGSYNESAGLCTTRTVPVCLDEDEEIYDPVTGLCYLPHECPSGGTVMRGEANKCVLDATYACPDPYGFSSSSGKCELQAVCSPGAYDPVTGTCKAVVTASCEGVYGLNATSDRCESPPVCPGNGLGYSTILDACTFNAIHDCVISGYTYAGLPTKMCWKDGTCPDGTPFNEETGGCGSEYNCPHGPQYNCVTVAGSDDKKCSPNTCVIKEQYSGKILTTNDNTMLQDDGPRDSSGNCLGTVYLFTGRGQRCRTAGINTSFSNCCNLSSDSPVGDSTGSSINMAMTAVKTIKTVYQMAQVAYYTNTAVTAGSMAALSGTGYATASAAVTGAVEAGYAAGSITAGLQTYMVAMFNPATIAFAVAFYLATEYFFSGSCDQEDYETSVSNQAKQCHYLGTYCEEEWPVFGGCAQKAKAYCCFNSQLGCIIHEQGRPQLKSFNLASPGDWVMSKNDSSIRGNCRGFTPEEFQGLDFSKIDLSAYFTDIINPKVAEAQEGLQQQLLDKTDQYYQNIDPRVKQ